MMGRRMVAMVLVGAALGCGDDGTEPEVIESSFELTVTGDLTESAEGVAWFGTEEDESGEDFWGLLLEDTESRHVIIVGKPGTSRPGVGTYDLDTTLEGNGWTLLHVVAEGEELVEMFFPVSGSVTITESSSRVVRGTVEFDAMGVLSAQPLEIEVTGTFVAVPATEGSASLAGRP